MDGQPALLMPAGGQLPAKRSRQGTALVAAALALVGAVLAWVDPVVALFAKALVDPLFQGTSAGAAVSLLGLMALGAVALAIAQTGVSSLAVRVASVFLLAGVVFGNLANLAQHLELMRSHGLAPTLAVYAWTGDTNTYSYLLHAHTGKAALHALFSAWAGPAMNGFDIGTGLASLVSAFWGSTCLVGLLCAAAGYAVLLPAVVARWPGWPMPLLFGFGALNSLKTIVDGGPLTYRFAPALAVLLLILPALLGLGRQVRLAAGLLAALGLAVSCAISFALSGPLAGDMVSGLAMTLSVIVALAAWAWRPATASQRGLRMAGLGGASLVVVAGLLAALMATPWALLTPLPADTRATVCNTDSGRCDQRSVAGQRAFDVYREAGDDPLKPRRTMLAASQDEGHSRLLFAIHPLRTQPARAGFAGPVQLTPLRALPGGAGLLVEASSGSLPSVFNSAPGPFSAANYYVFLHLAAAGLRAQGLADCLMAPLRGADDARALGLQVVSSDAP